MPRIKRTIDYINELRFDTDVKKRLIGDKLEAQYAKWIKSLNLKEFLAFNNFIQENKAEIGVAQFFGKFRACAFEEYVYRLLQTKIRLKEPLQIFWGEKCLVWREDEKEYAMEFDVAIGRKINGFITPTIVFDAKVELDSARLKTALASFAILKQWNPQVKCFLIYVVKDVNYAFIDLASHWIDGIFRLSPEKNETDAFLYQVAKNVG